MKVLFGLLILITTSVLASGKKCFAPVLCTEGDASYPEWMQVSPALRSASEITCTKSQPEEQEEGDKYKKPGITHTSIKDSFKSETEASLKKFNGSYFILNSTVDSLKTETDVKLKEMNESNLKLKQELNSIADAVKTAEEEIDNFNEKFSQMEKKLNSTLKKLEIALGSNCELTYNGKCFHAIVHDKRDVNFTAADGMCNNGWKLANIYSRRHYDILAEYLRPKDDPRNWIGVWLGMTYHAGNLYLSDGTQFTEALPWFPGYPKSDTSRNKMYIDVRKDSSDEGIVNYPATSETRGALCEI